MEIVKKGYDTTRTDLFKTALESYQNEVFGLVQKRKAVKLSQNDMSEALGVTLRTITAFEKGESTNGVIAHAYRLKITNAGGYDADAQDKINALRVYEAYPTYRPGDTARTARLKFRKENMKVIEAILSRYSVSFVLDVMQWYIDLADQALGGNYNTFQTFLVNFRDMAQQAKV